MKYNKQVSVGYNADGKRIRKWIHADSKQELKRKETELFKNVREELYGSKTFGVYAQEWFQAYKSGKSINTQKHYKSMLRYLKSLDNKPLKRVTNTDLQRIITANSKHPTTAQRLAGTMQQIMESAMADNLIPPTHIRLEVPKPSRPKTRALSGKEKEAIKAAELPAMERLMLDMVFYLGLRPQEMRAIAVSDFDWKDLTVTISKAVFDADTGAKIKGTKTGVVRILPLPPVLVAEIRDYLKGHSNIYLFVDDTGQLLSRGRFARITQTIFEGVAAKLEYQVTGLTWYTLRHNRATELYYLPGISTKKKAEYMGHSEMMFLRTYSHLDDSKEELELLRKVL